MGNKKVELLTVIITPGVEAVVSVIARKIAIAQGKDPLFSLMTARHRAMVRKHAQTPTQSQGKYHK